jgi:phosphoribosylformylglycinamidine cyclo-ligase
MCVNDLYTIGARPLFFIDYFATGVLDEHQFKDALTGIKEACKSCGTALLGGETAEMPGLYAKGHFDMAGFVVGVVDGKKVLGPERVKVGDELFAIQSSGFHSNGYSLVRKWLEKNPNQSTTKEQLLTPTKIYHELPDLLNQVGTDTVHALANITGGGISGNLPRVMPRNVACEINFDALNIPDWVTQFITDNGSTPLDVEGVFNLGAGMIASIASDHAEKYLTSAREIGLETYKIGQVVATDGAPKVIFK